MKLNGLQNPYPARQNEKVWGGSESGWCATSRRGRVWFDVRRQVRTGRGHVLDESAHLLQAPENLVFDFYETTGWRTVAVRHDTPILTDARESAKRLASRRIIEMQ